MKYILSLCAVCTLALGLTVTSPQKVEAGSRRNAAIAGAIIGGAIAGAAISRHHHSRRHYEDYDDSDDYAEVEYVRARPRYRRCYRERRCYWKHRKMIWRNGERYYRPAHKRCRRVRVCR